MTKQQKTLWDAAITGDYPTGTTAADLAAYVNTQILGAPTALHRAALFNQLPVGTTIADLANCKDNTGKTALHEAAHSGCLPKGTTAADLAACKDRDDNTALHTAAYYGRLPKTTTTNDLATCRDKWGRAALHNAAVSQKLPADTTATHLINCHDNQGKTAWESFLNHCDIEPDTAFQISPTFFLNQQALAIQYAQTTTTKHPKLLSKGALWLAKVIAAHQQQNHTQNEGAERPK